MSQATPEEQIQVLIKWIEQLQKRIEALEGKRKTEAVPEIQNIQLGAVIIDSELNKTLIGYAEKGMKVHAIYHLAKTMRWNRVHAHQFYLDNYQQYEKIK